MATSRSSPVQVQRTPDERFADLPDFPFEPHYVDVDGVRMAYIDEGEGQPVLMLHGEPTWSFLFRNLIPPMRDAGYRCIAIDYAGFGRSDKPVDLEWYSYDAHTDLCRAVIEHLDLRDIVLVAHDWGGQIGLRLAVDDPQRFDRYVLMDTPFFTGRQSMPPVWFVLRDMLEANTDPSISQLVQAGCARPLPPQVLAAYDAPFPNADSKTGPRAFPIRVLPLSADLPAAKAGWRVLKSMRKFDTRPTLMLWGENDVLFPLQLGQWCAGALRRELPVPISGASHFVLEDTGEEVERLILDWLGSSG